MTMQDTFFPMDGNNGNNFIGFDRMNNQNSYRPPSSSQNGQQTLDANALATMLQQQQMQMQMNSQQQMAPSQGNSMNHNDQQQSSVNISNEIKRLQQLHQMNSSGASGNALLMQGSQRSPNDASLLQSMFEQKTQGGQRNPNDASLLQSMFEQKTQNPRFDTSLSQGMVNGGVNQMLQPGFFQDSRLFMNPNQMSNTNNMNQGFLQQADIANSSPHSLFHRDVSRRMRGGVIEPFPEKLHRLLREVEAAGRSDVISFIAGGRAFAIHNSDSFFKDIVPLYFRQSRLSSFKRQLNLYGFELINAGPARGGYFHELFVKDRPELCRRMRRVAVKISTKQERGDDSENNHDESHVPGENKVDGEPIM